MSVSRTSVNPLQSGTEIKIFDLKQDNCIIYRSLSILVYNKYTIINAVTYKKEKLKIKKRNHRNVNETKIFFTWINVGHLKNGLSRWMS